MDIETLYRLYFRDVALFLQGLTHSEALTEELTQETFFKALNALDSFDGKQDIRAWLFTIARNCYYSQRLPIAARNGNLENLFYSRAIEVK